MIIKAIFPRLSGNSIMNGLFEGIFSEIPDPRINRTRKHLFLDIIGLALFAVLVGAQAYTEIEDFCCHHEDWLL